MVTVHRATKDEFLKLDGFYREFSDGGGSARNILKKWAEEQDPEGSVIYAREADTIVGAGYVRVCDRKLGIFASWLVRPDARKRGIATHLDRFAFRLLHQSGIRKATLNVDPNTISLARLLTMQNNGTASLERRGSVVLLFALLGAVSAAAKRKESHVRKAEQDEEFLVWYRIRFSKEYNFYQPLYGEDRSFHLLTRTHVQKLIAEGRVYISGKMLIGGVVIIQKTFLCDKLQQPIYEIGFSCGTFQPILQYLFRRGEADAVFAAYAFSRGQARCFMAEGFALRHGAGREAFDSPKYDIYSYFLK